MAMRALLHRIWPVLWMGCFSVVTAGCEPVPERFVFVNDTNAPVELFFDDPVKGPYAKQEIAPGADFVQINRPRAFHGEKLFIKVDDEEQFRHFFRFGITLVDGKGRRSTLDVTKLRAQMTFEEFGTFTMHIRPDLFEPTR